MTANVPRVTVSAIVAAALLPAGLKPPQASAQGYAPTAAAKHFKAAEGLRVELFASEPEVRQPIFVKCDDRGRLWTIQYLQYPNPAGLVRVKVDRWSRTEYDRIPEPPPRGPRGADRITILEDVDGDGRADVAKDFIDGLNLVTGVEFGHGGVFVLNVPYLLFYPDANRDDVPDADPEVLLTGFGMEDAQAMSNHLTWGPDGWLYGVNGSTTTCRIRGLEFQQGLWRYHPLTREFELFCEGGSNCYGVTFDAHGECFYSTNGGPFVHAVQGGYFYKSFGKHGPLHNLYAYHFFPELERDQVPGGPPTGGTMYLSDAFPARFRNTFIAGNFLGHTVSAWTVTPKGSTFRATFSETLFDAQDAWSGPTDVCLAPDGAIYVSDFFDQRTAHPDPDANWDRSNGRIYKISAADSPRDGHVDIHSLSSSELVDLLSHSNRWYADRARIELAHRRDSSVVDRLRKMALRTDNESISLQGLWALHASSHIDDSLAIKLLNHPLAYTRYWTVRLLGDQRNVSPPVLEKLIQLAREDASPVVRSQLAATARRLPAEQLLPIVEAHLRAHPDEADERITWLLWWAIESKAMSDAPRVVGLFNDEAMWTNPAARGNALRLVRRYAAEGASAGYQACAKLLMAAPSEYVVDAQQCLRQGLAERSTGLFGIGQGALFGQHAAAGDGAPQTAERRFEQVDGSLKKYIYSCWNQAPESLLTLELALRADLDGARDALQGRLSQVDANVDEQIKILGLYREFGSQEARTKILELIQGERPEAVKLAALDASSAFLSEETAQLLMKAFMSATPAVQSKIRDLLFTKADAAMVFLNSVEAGDVRAEDVPIDQVRRLAFLKNPEIDDLVRKHWGSIGPGSSEEKLAIMRRYNNDLRPGGGNSQRGQELFAKHCATCHKLNGTGNDIGPDLTTANRQDLAALLANIVDPSSVIRREYTNYIVYTASGQTYSGLLAEQDGASVTVLNAQNQRIKLSRDEIEEITESDVSLMPERILENLTPQELRDLFSYLQGAPAK